MKIDGFDPLIFNRIQSNLEPFQAEPNLEALQLEGLVDLDRGLTGDALPEIDKDALMEEVQKDLEQFNDALQAFDKALEFRLHKDSERWMVEVRDLEKDEIIKEMPPERVLNVIAQIQAMIGLIVDEKR